MSTARPLSSLLSAGAVVALTLAAPGTALADPGNGVGAQKGAGASSATEADTKAEKDAGERGATDAQPPAEQDKAKDKPAQGKPAKPAQQAKDKPAKPAKDKPAKPATQPADAAPQSTGADATKDPAGNNGTIKIDTVPGDPDRANRPHPGCAFVLQFFNFDADQTADITFTGQAPTRSAGPLLSLSGQTISTTPADGALEDGHSLTLTAADLGLVGTPTAAKGWHVKVAVDALEAPGGAKQKVFWLDCSSATAPTVTEDEEQVGANGDAAVDATVVGKGAEDRSEQLEQPADGALLGAFGDGVGVLSGSATREVTRSTQQGAAGVSGEAGAATAVAPAADSRSTTSLLPSALPFTGPAGLAAMLAAGLGALGAGALAVRAGRRRTTAAATD